MHINDYFHSVLMPANTAVSAIQRAGLPMLLDRVIAQKAVWLTKIRELERFVESEAEKVGVSVTYSPAHTLSPKVLQDLLYKGLELPITKRTAPSKTFPDGQPSTDDEALTDYASISVPRPSDHPVVTAILKIRSLAKGVSTNLDGYSAFIRADGCIHTNFRWNLATPRLASEKPNLQNIPERADTEVASGIKSCFVPRVKPARISEEWDPRKHGWCGRWDIMGSEAVIRAAMLTARFCTQPDPIAYDYLRYGKDIHAKTASLIYSVPEGTYTKGSYQRDAVGKQTFFASLFGGGWTTVKHTILDRARIRLSDDEAKTISRTWRAGYSGVMELLELDKRHLGEYGYCEDGYGRRRKIALPDGCKYLGYQDGQTSWSVLGQPVRQEDDISRNDKSRRFLWKQLEHAFFVAANSPTQGISATDTLWMLALLHHGEYVELAVPPMWEKRGLLFPEAATWAFNEGKGPGGKPFQVWHSNTVHDSAWMDGAPGTLEPAMKLVSRRCTAVPFDWRLEADCPYRIDFQVGPDFGHLEDYNVVAKRFGFAPLPKD